LWGEPLISPFADSANVNDVLPPGLIALINRALASIDHVEVLLLLHREASHPLTTHEIATRLHLTDDVADAIVAELAAGGLIAATETGHRYHASAADEPAIAALADAYNARPVTLVRAIYARPSRAKPLVDRFAPDPQPNG
jgi:hypothetical protein